MDTALVMIVAFAVLAIYLVAASVKVVPAAHTFVIERLGRYRVTLEPGVHLTIPIVDRVRHKVGMGEQVSTMAREQVITQDNYVVLIDALVYFQIVDPRAAMYEVVDHERAIDRLTVSTLRDLVGNMDLAEVVTSAELVSTQLRTVISHTADTWGIRVHRVDITAIDPPGSGEAHHGRG